MPYKIAISAGELSGDEHAAKLVAAIKALHSDTDIRGMGGRYLRAAGVNTVVDSERAASAMGFQEVLSQLPKIFGAMNAMKKFLHEWRPDILILVDFPDFNLRLAKYAHSIGIKVFYFIMPKLWAWRAGRVESFKKYVDHAALIFPFEKKFFEDLSFTRCTYVGHPFASDFKPTSRTREQVFDELGLDSNAPTVAILPGSRKGEIQRHLNKVLGAFNLLKTRVPKVQGIIVVAPSLESSKDELLTHSSPNLKVTTLSSLEIMSVCDAGLIKSGTSNLQAAFCNLPFVMFFVTTALTAAIVKRFVKIKQYSLVNIIRPNSIVELVQDKVNPQTISDHLHQLLTDPKAADALRENLCEVRELLSTGGGNAYENTAKLIIDSLLARKQ